MCCATHLHGGEPDAHQEIGHPVDEHRYRHRRRPRPLREQLRGYHPGNRARSDGEEHHETQDGDHRQVRHPVYHLLHVTEKLLIRRCSGAVLSRAREE